jgi:hypothetical protein
MPFSVRKAGIHISHNHLEQLEAELELMEVACHDDD